MLRLTILIWLGLISYKIYETYNPCVSPVVSQTPSAVQENPVQKPSFNPEWKGTPLQKIKAPRNSNARMTAIHQDKTQE